MKEFKLDTEPKITSGFKAPEHYFENFQSKVIKRLPEQEVPVISLLSRKKTWLYAVAAVFVIGFSIPLINTLTVSKPEIDSAILDNYLTNHATLSDEDIVEQLDEEDIQKIKVEINIDDKDLEDILTTNCNIEEYIN